MLVFCAQVLKMPKNARDNLSFQSVVREIDILRGLKHPNVVGFMGNWSPSPSPSPSPPDFA